MSEEIPPGTGLINSIRAEKSPYYLWAGEAIDNAFDAYATDVHLQMSEDALDAIDNGIGITIDRDHAIVKISEHGEMPGTKLGRFGVGIKYKSIQHAKQFHINSVSKDGRLRRRVDWENILQSGKWIYPDPVRTAVPDGTPTGTIISFRHLIRKPPTKTDVDRTRYEIQRRYYPALEAGRSVSLNGERVPGLPLPLMTDVVRDELSFADGRSARVFGGLLGEPSAAKLRQVDLIVDFRVIKPESAFGCDGFGGIRSMFARVELLGPWQLTKFKDDIAEDPYLDDLEIAIERVLRPILEKCQSQSMVMKTKTLEQIINDMLPSGQQMTRPQQVHKLDRKGPKNEDKRTRELDKSEPSITGPTKRKKPPRGILIEFAPDLHAEYGFGRAQCGKSSTRIQLATDNPSIRQLMNFRDQQIAAIGLFSIAMLLYEGDLQTAAPRLLDEPIGLRAWRLAGSSIIEQVA